MKNCRLFLSIVSLFFTTSLFSQNVNLLSEEELDEAVVFTDIEKALKAPEEVYILDLSSKGLAKVPKTLTKFRNLQVLILTDNQLTEIPVELIKMKKLQSLFLDSNNIEQVFFDLADPRNFQSLENLYLGFNPIKTLPENIKGLQLSMISLSGCKFLDMTKVFIPLSTINGLEHLVLSHLNLDTIPWGVVNLFSMHILDLSANPNMAWDTSLRFLSQHKGLEELILQNNKLSGIPAEVSRFANLESLDLSYNDQISIRQVFEATKGIEKLSSLDLSHCALKEIPITIGEQKKLFDLYLSHNKIKRLPREIGKLEQLETLDLSNNLLSELPEEFGDIQNLEYLLVGNNPLEFLPSNMSNLNDLKYVELPKETLDKEVKKSIKKYFPKAEIEFVKTIEAEDN